MAKEKGLGRGIGALFGDSFEQFEDFDKPQLTDEVVEEVSVLEIRPNPYQPRRYFNEERLKELAESIRENGVFQPIVVRKSAVKGYELIAGERRLRASKLASKETIPCIVRDYSDEVMIQIAVLENLQREDLDPIDEANAYQMMMDELKLSQEEVAKRLGKSRPYIANYVRLLTLPKEVQQMVQDGILSVGHARTLLGLKEEGKRLELAKYCLEHPMTVRQLEEYVHELNAPVVVKKKPAKKVKEKPLYVQESEQRLREKFGTEVVITPKGKKGKIEIEYLSEDDLTRILDVLQIQFDEE